MKGREIYTGIAKTNVELQRLTHTVPMQQGRRAGSLSPENPGIMYVITQEEIVAKDIDRFLANFGPTVTKKRLSQIAGRISFTVHGYEDRAEELFEIPEVREYFQLAHKCWPCWLFAADIRTACLHAITLCVVPNLDIVRASATGINQIQVPNIDLKGFFSQSLLVTAIMDVRAGITRSQAAKRIKVLAEHLGV
ncbi:hypothetical protein DB345_21280 [Spartobacteria bacterium LR76]|nr:hypothetical protein DB345_21280 [Spartobacteria bacterium LR76]